VNGFVQSILAVLTSLIPRLIWGNFGH